MRWRLLGLLVLAIFGSWAAWAATTQNAIVTTQVPKFSSCTFVQGTDVAGTYKTCYAGGVNGSKIRGIYVSSNDVSAAHLVTVQVSSSSTAHCSPQSNCLGGAAITIPINSGFANGVPSVNAMSPLNWPGLPNDSDANPFLYLTGTSYTIEATFTTALTASTQIAVNVIGEDF